jgi:hypothetical protein
MSKILNTDDLIMYKLFFLEGIDFDLFKSH